MKKRLIMFIVIFLTACSIQPENSTSVYETLTDDGWDIYLGTMTDQPYGYKFLGIEKETNDEKIYIHIFYDIEIESDNIMIESYTITTSYRSNSNSSQFRNTESHVYEALSTDTINQSFYYVSDTTNNTSCNYIQSKMDGNKYSNDCDEDIKEKYLSDYINNPNSKISNILECLDISSDEFEVWFNEHIIEYEEYQNKEKNN